jgi:hypothetical protein
MSNLKNQPQCSAHSKRTGLLCKQPRMSGKQVCRFHGGKSTGPKTVQGRQRIREANLRHGRYSKITKEYEAQRKKLKLEKEVFQLQDKVLDKHLKRIKELEPYIQALTKANSREEYGLIRIFLFGRLNKLIKSNPLLKMQFREFFALLFEEGALVQFEALIDKLDHYIFQKLDIPAYIWKQLTPEQRHEEYIQQLLLKVMELTPDIRSAWNKPVLNGTITYNQKDCKTFKKGLIEALGNYQDSL